MNACASRVVCMRTYGRDRSSVSSPIHASVASNRSATCGRLLLRTIMSPREMSISSSRVITTDWPADPSSSAPSMVSTVFTCVAIPLGSATTSSPGDTVPLAIRPA